jgi:hypothetical protein
VASHEQDGGVVRVDCSVVPEGGAFRVRASARWESTEGDGREAVASRYETYANVRSLTIEGLFTSGLEERNVKVTFEDDRIRIEQPDCAVRYRTDSRVKMGAGGPGVGPGRVAASLSCGTLVDRAGRYRCEGYADVWFEGCASK